MVEPLALLERYTQKLYDKAQEYYDEAVKIEDQKAYYSNKENVSVMFYALMGRILEERALLKKIIPQIRGAKSKIKTLPERFEKRLAKNSQIGAKSRIIFVSKRLYNFLDDILKLLKEFQVLVVKEYYVFNKPAKYLKFYKEEQEVRAQIDKLIMGLHFSQAEEQEIRAKLEQEPSTLRRIAASLLLVLFLALSACSKEKPAVEKAEESVKPPVAEAPEQPTKPLPTDFEYLIKMNEVLWDIRVKYKEIMPDWNEFLIRFKQLNPNVSPNNIKPGLKVRLPLKKGEKPPEIKRGKFYIDSGDPDVIRHIISQEDPEVILARVFMGEAELCTDDAKKAIWVVIRLRMLSPDFPDTVAGVVLEANKFSAFWDNTILAKMKDPETYNPDEFKRNLGLAKKFVDKNYLLEFSVMLHYHDENLPQHAGLYLLVRTISNGKPGGVFSFYVASDDRLTEHFNVDEFMCPCGCRGFQLQSELLFKLEDMRKKAKVPIRIISAYRCPTQNRKTKGPVHSQLGTGVDIVVTGMTVPDMVDLASGPGFTVTPLAEGIQVRVGR